MAGPAVIRVGIVEDDSGIREGLSVLIGGSPGYRCVGRYDSVEQALRGMPGEMPDVLLLDINLPGMRGSDGVAMFKERFPAVQILMLTVYAEQSLVFDSICNGACGYLLKTTPPARLIEAIREVQDGGAPMSPEIARKVVSLFQKTRRARLDPGLTPHEQRLLKLLAEGLSYQALAEHFDISINTVRNYIRRIYDKLHVHSKSEAVSKALRNGLIV